MKLVSKKMYKIDYFQLVKSMNLDQPAINQSNKVFVFIAISSFELFYVSFIITFLLDLRLLVFLSFDFPFVLGDEPNDVLFEIIKNNSNQNK